MLKYILLGLAMMSDVFFILVSGLVFGLLDYFNPTLPAFLVVFGVFLFGLLDWRDSGGFANWRPSSIRQYLANAKELGW